MLTLIRHSGFNYTTHTSLSVSGRPSRPGYWVVPRPDGFARWIGRTFGVTARCCPYGFESAGVGSVRVVAEPDVVRGAPLSLRTGSLPGARGQRRGPGCTTLPPRWQPWDCGGHRFARVVPGQSRCHPAVIAETVSRDCLDKRRIRLCYVNMDIPLYSVYRIDGS